MATPTTKKNGRLKDYPSPEELATPTGTDRARAGSRPHGGCASCAR